MVRVQVVILQDLEFQDLDPWRDDDVVRRNVAKRGGGTVCFGAVRQREAILLENVVFLWNLGVEIACEDGAVELLRVIHQFFELDLAELLRERPLLAFSLFHFDMAFRDKMHAVERDLLAADVVDETESTITR